MSNTIECEEFHKLMQLYRHMPTQMVPETIAAYRAVIDYIDKDRANLRDEKTVCLMTISSMGDEIAELKSERARIIAATVEMCAKKCENARFQNASGDAALKFALEDIRAITPEQVLEQLALNANKEQS